MWHEGVKLKHVREHEFCRDTELSLPHDYIYIFLFIFFFGALECGTIHATFSQQIPRDLLQQNRPIGYSQTLKLPFLEHVE